MASFGQTKSPYRVFQRKTWCFEMLVWLGFWIFCLLINLGVVLSLEIYAWSTIWNLFDLRQPQQPLIKSVQIQMWFFSIFVQILINFSFFFWGYMTQNVLGMTAYLIPSIFVWFQCDYANFSTLLKSYFFPFSPNYYFWSFLSSDEIFSFVNDCSTYLVPR